MLTKATTFPISPRLAEIVAEVQLRKYRIFLEDYAKGLLDVEDALDESRGDAWDYTLDPISLDVCPQQHLCPPLGHDSRPPAPPNGCRNNSHRASTNARDSLIVSRAGFATAPLAHPPSRPPPPASISKPHSVQLTPHEQASALDLVRTENKVFNKTITVFMVLCQEIAELRNEAETQFYAPLLLYGEVLRLATRFPPSGRILPIHKQTASRPCVSECEP